MAITLSLGSGQLRTNSVDEVIVGKLADFLKEGQDGMLSMNDGMFYK